MVVLVLNPTQRVVVLDPKPTGSLLGSEKDHVGLTPTQPILDSRLFHYMHNVMHQNHADFCSQPNHPCNTYLPNPTKKKNEKEKKRRGKKVDFEGTFNSVLLSSSYAYSWETLYIFRRQ
jgi:hypothetical protein